MCGYAEQFYSRTRCNHNCYSNRFLFWKITAFASRECLCQRSWCDTNQECCRISRVPSNKLMKYTAMGIAALLLFFLTGCYPISPLRPGKERGYCIWNATDRAVQLVHAAGGRAYAISPGGCVTVQGAMEGKDDSYVLKSAGRTTRFALSGFSCDLSFQNGVAWEHLVINPSGEVECGNRSSEREFVRSKVHNSSPRRSW